MKKKLSLRIVTLCVVMVMITSLMPFSVSAAKTLVINPVKNLMPGGAEVSFHDEAGSGGSVRGLETDGDVVVLRKSEWLKYDLSSLDAGKYIVYVTAGATSSVSVSVSINDEEVLTGGALKSTGSYFNTLENNLGSITVSEGKSVLTIKNKGSNCYLYGIRLANYDNYLKQQEIHKQHRPYKMSYLPCIIQAENFDSGLNGKAYFDADDVNQGGVYRAETGVDIYEKDGIVYTSVSTGDWVSYTVKVKKDANYDLILKSVDPVECSKVRVFADGYEIVRIIPENKMAYGDFRETVIESLHLKKGTHTFTFKCMDGDINIDYIRFGKSKTDGIDISNTAVLRKWEDAQTLTEEDMEDNSVKVQNPVEREIYVVSGSQGGNGSKESPFGTIQQARDYVKTVNDNMKGDIVVNLSGVFELSDTVSFTADDSGSNGFNIIYRGDGTTKIHGGRKVTGWNKVDGTPLYKTKLPDVEDFRQLYIGENRGVRSRTKWMYWMKDVYDDPETKYSYADGFIMEGSDFSGGFSKPLDMELIWHPSWRNVRVPVNTFEKTASGDYQVTFPGSCLSAAYMQSAPIALTAPYYIENAPEFLDEPGEFYFDKDTKVLTYYPTEDEDMQTIDCYIPKLEKLIDISGENTESKIRNITFEGIKFMYGAWERTTEKGFGTLQSEQVIASEEESGFLLIPGQVQVKYGDNINFYKNEFSHMGSVALSYNNGTANSEITGNIFDDNSATAITVGDWNLTAQSAREEYCRKVKITNNLFRRQSVEYMTPVVSVYQTNNVTFDHNDMKDAPCSGISMGWGWGRQYELVAYNHITNNKIDNAVYKLKDGANIYTLDANKGGKISGNYVTKAGEWKGGIYHDNSSAYWTTTNNVFEDVYKWHRIGFHNIRDNVAYDNYCERPHVCSYPDQNNIQDAKGKVNGEWPDEAKQIINNAGITDDYKFILEEYEKRQGLRNSILEMQPFAKSPGIFVEAGRYMEGGEGVAYHETLSNASYFNVMGEPTIHDMYNGTRLLFIIVTEEGEWTKYKVDIPESGYYEVIPNIAVVQQGTAISVEVDDKPAITKYELEPNCKLYDVYKEFNIGKVYLEKGEHTIKIEHAVHNFGFESFRLVKEGATMERNDGYNYNLLNVILSK